jgi:hypothetical protein
MYLMDQHVLLLYQVNHFVCSVDMLKISTQTALFVAIVPVGLEFSFYILTLFNLKF